eukprot:2441124-Alexandrium_andersonii.AAC.1
MVLVEVRGGGAGNLSSFVGARIAPASRHHVGGNCARVLDVRLDLVDGKGPVGCGRERAPQAMPE